MRATLNCGLKGKRHMSQIRWFRAFGLAAISLMLSLTVAAQPSDQPGLPGKYTKEGTSVNLFLNTAFGWVLFTPGESRPRVGHYIIDGNTVTLIQYSSGQSTLFTIQGNKLYDPDGAAWVKPEDTPAPAPAADTDQSVGLPEAPETYTSSVSGAQLILNPDKTSMTIGRDGQRSPGHWSYVYGERHEGSLLTLVPSLGGRSAVLKVQGNNLIDNATGEEWDRTEDAVAGAPEAAPAPPMPAIAPPPPPPDAPPPTIALGQTMDQVTAGFGQPLKVAKLGAKTIFYYKDMKVTFINGKVSNVE